MNTNTSETKLSCPALNSLKHEYEDKIAKINQEIEACGNHQTMGIGEHLYIIGIIQINSISMKELNSRTKIE